MVENGGGVGKRLVAGRRVGDSISRHRVDVFGQADELGGVGEELGEGFVVLLLHVAVEAGGAVVEGAEQVGAGGGGVAVVVASIRSAMAHQAPSPPRLVGGGPMRSWSWWLPGGAAAASRPAVGGSGQGRR